MKYFGMPSLAQGPIAFLDIQKLFSLAYEDGKSRKALEHAVDVLQVEKEIPLGVNHFTVLRRFLQHR